MVQRRRPSRWHAVAFLALAVVMATPGVAAAGGDPYGPTSTDPPPPPNGEVTCSLSISGGTADTPGTATVTGVGAGQSVRIVIGGVESGNGSAPPGAPGTTTTVNVSFTVPDLESGSYLVSAVGTTFTAECDGEFEITEVGGVSIENPDGGGSGSNGGGVAGSLPTTGIYVGLLLAIAVALIVLGRSALAASRRRKRRAWADVNRVRRLTRSDLGSYE